MAPVQPVKRPVDKNMIIHIAYIKQTILYYAQFCRTKPMTLENPTSLKPRKPLFQQDSGNRDGDDLEYWRKIFNLPGGATLSDILDAQNQYRAWGWAGQPADGANIEVQKKGPEKKKSSWPGKPVTDQDWLNYAKKKVQQPGTTVTFDPIRPGRSRGRDIVSRIDGRGANYEYGCGCKIRMDNDGNEYRSPCEDHMDE